MGLFVHGNLLGKKGWPCFTCSFFLAWADGRRDPWDCVSLVPLPRPPNNGYKLSL